MLTYDKENINSTNLGGNLQPINKLLIVPRGTEGMLQAD